MLHEVYLLHEAYLVQDPGVTLQDYKVPGVGGQLSMRHVESETDYNLAVSLIRAVQLTADYL